MSNTGLFEVFSASDFGQDTMLLHLFVKPLEQALKALVTFGCYTRHMISPSLMWPLLIFYIIWRYYILVGRCGCVKKDLMS